MILSQVLGEKGAVSFPVAEDISLPPLRKKVLGSNGTENSLKE